MIFAVSDKVWIDLIQLATLVVGLVSVWMQQRNKGVTERTTKDISEALAENTAITQKAADRAEQTHNLVKTVVPE